MRALLINAVCGIRSTGRICTDLAKKLEEQGYEVKIAYSRETVPTEHQKYAVRIGNKFDVYWHALMTKLFDGRGYWSKRATRKFLKWADEYDPDVLWLHNIHDYVINIEMLFDWIKSRPDMQVKWTQHDCWAFTGGCMHFTVAECYQWEKHCRNCPTKCTFPREPLFRQPKRNFERKRNAFTGVNNMTVISVSHWLENHVKNSFLKDYPIEVVYNSVNREVFRPTTGNLREMPALADKKIILGVASFWNEKKGLSDFIRLSKMLPDNMRIVLVGLSKKQIKSLPDNIVGVDRTNNAAELAGIYSEADVFVNLSKEETFGLTTLEALCCETPVIVYKDTACEEVANMYGGIAVEQDLMAVKNKILQQINI